ncbi:hypothetical protein COOONC_24780 [Cooperia oncophora]
MARDMGISRKSMERVVHEDLKMYPYQALHRRAAVQRSERQSDRKECRGSRQEGKSRSPGRTPCPSHGLGRGVCLGKTPLIFVDPGVKIDKDYYLKTILEDALLPWANSHFNGRPWTFQQDSALAHKAKVVQAWCKTSSRQKNGRHQQGLRQHIPTPNLDSLKAALIREWDEIDDALLRPVIDAFPKRLRAVVRAKGGRIEKHLSVDYREDYQKFVWIGHTGECQFFVPTFTSALCIFEGSGEWKVTNISLYSQFYDTGNEDTDYEVVRSFHNISCL